MKTKQSERQPWLSNANNAARVFLHQS